MKSVSSPKTDGGQENNDRGEATEVESRMKQALQYNRVSKQGNGINNSKQI